MFVHIFKSITAILLVGLLFVLATQRELIITPQVKKITRAAPQKNNTDTDQLLDQKKIVPPPEIVATTTLEKPLPPQETPPSVSQQPLAKVETLPKKSLYIPMEEGASDTDTSYRPSISPCHVPMGYTIGTFDTHFGISQATFIEEIDAAASLWGAPLGKTLFKYTPSGTLTINLIYDERQARTDDVNNLALEIDNAKITADTLKTTYEQEKIVYLGDSDQLTKDTDIFKARYQAYTDKVAMYNSQGGAPRNEYDLMTKELEALKQLSKDLIARRDALLLYMETINAKVNRYNELVVYINSLIQKSNSLGAKTFTEGRFTPRTNTIDIYQYNDLIKLRRVIAHELGHVLGINHTESVQSIMYAMNSGTSTALNKDDLAALKAVCPQ